MKGKGLSGMIKEIIMFILVAGFLLALLAAFNNDIGAAVTSVLNMIWKAILSVANFFTQLGIFKNFV